MRARAVYSYKARGEWQKTREVLGGARRVAEVILLYEKQVAE